MSELIGTLVMFIVYAVIIGGLAIFVIKGFSKGMFPTEASGVIRVLDRVMLAPNKGLVMVRISDKYLLIAVSDQDVKVIKEFSSEDIKLPQAKPKDDAFAKVLNTLIGRVRGERGEDEEKRRPGDKD